MLLKARGSTTPQMRGLGFLHVRVMNRKFKSTRVLFLDTSFTENLNIYMKKLNAVLMFIVLISSNILAQTNNIEVNGTLRGVKYGELIISEHDNVGEPSVIHIKSKIENGKVNITAPIEYPFKGIIFVKGTNYKTYWFFEPGDSYTVQIFNKDLIIEGGKTEKLMFESGAVSQEIMEMNMKFMGDEAGAIVSEDEKEIKKVISC